MAEAEKTVNNGVQLVEISADEAGQRVDNFLSARLKGVPRERIYRILRKGEVRVNKKRVKPPYRLEAGDLLRIPPVHIVPKTQPAAASNQLLETLDERILYEDEQLLVINKPAGLAVHGGSGIRLGLIEALRQLRPQVTGLELVHRLDRDTSGCLLVAKKRSALRHLHESLRSGKVDKRYLALVAGRWPSHCNLVNAPLLKNNLRSGERVVRVDKAGKPSRTEFRVVQCYQRATLVEAKPITGRTHQIRVHAQYVGHSLIGDDKYTEDETNRDFKAFGFARLFLHAYQLGFPSPADGRWIQVEAPLEADLQLGLDNLTPA